MGKYVFQGVGMLFSGGFCEIEWKKDETRECRFVFIGRNLDKEDLIAGVMKCEFVGELRFKVGDKVMANIGKWVKGKIIRCWDDGNPYRIELKDGKNTNVWGPMDDDYFVKAYVKNK